MRSKLEAGEPDTPLYRELKQWRLETARETGVAAYVVFNNRTLAEIAVAEPANEDELMAVSGVGKAKFSKYGDEVLALIRDR